MKFAIALVFAILALASTEAGLFPKCYPDSGFGCARLCNFWPQGAECLEACRNNPGHYYCPAKAAPAPPPAAGPELPAGPGRK